LRRRGHRLGFIGAGHNEDTGNHVVKSLPFLDTSRDDVTDAVKGRKIFRLLLLPVALSFPLD